MRLMTHPMRARRHRAETAPRAVVGSHRKEVTHMAKTATYGLPETTTTMLESIVTMAQGMNDAERQQLLEAGKSILLVRDLRNMADNKPA